MHSDTNRRIFGPKKSPRSRPSWTSCRSLRLSSENSDYPRTPSFLQGPRGIYMFNRKILIECLNNDLDYFGKHIIPSSLQTYKVMTYIFQGFWEDIGTGRAFFRSEPGSGVSVGWHVSCMNNSSWISSGQRRQSHYWRIECSGTRIGLDRLPAPCVNSRSQNHALDTGPPFAAYG
jgi:ADP-glucose pyrophosphorylase